MNRPVGFSTGALRELVEPSEHLRIYKELGCDAIELCLVDEHRLFDDDWMDLSDQLGSFRYRSIHAPVLDLPGLPDIVERLRRLVDSLRIDAVVVHPDRITDLEALAALDLPITLENMDDTKRVGRFPEFFKDLPDGFQYCLDVQHVHRNDTSMALADDLASLWGSRLKQIHISGFGPEHIHEALFDKDHAHLIARAAEAIPSVPLIIESFFPDADLDRMRRELAFIHNSA